MYARHFGFKALPFENVPDPFFFFDSGDYNRVLHRMTDSLRAGKGLMAVAGPIGAGKTTLSQKLMSDVADSTSLIWMVEPPESAMDLFLFIGQELGIESPSNSRVFVIRDIRKRLLEIRDRGERCLMIVDESHLMSDEVLEGVRLLNNLEEGPGKLMQIILLGQPELIEIFSRPEMEPFRQRIAWLETIAKMEPQGVREYILHRLHVAGGKAGIFTEKALEAVAISTGGVPRVTNSLCDRSLRIAYEKQSGRVDAGEVHQAAMDIGLGRKTIHYLLKLRADQPAEKDSPAAARPPGDEDGEHPETGPWEVAPEGVEATRSGIALNLLLFASSLAALAASIWFYCIRAGIEVSTSAMRELADIFF